MTAFINGKAASLDAALDRAAELLRKAVAPMTVVAGADMAGCRAALRVAKACGAAFDHAASQLLGREAEAMRAGRYYFTTPREAASRADLVVAIGAEAARHAAGMSRQAPLNGAARRFVCIAPGRERPDGARVVDAAQPRLPGFIAALAAAAQGRPLAAEGAAGLSAAGLRELAKELRQAAFGVAIWSPSDLDALAIEALMALADALNAGTRFTALRLAPPGNAAGAAELALWSAGFPFRIGFASGAPRSDPWRYDAARMADSGECDAAVWISAFAPEAPRWRGATPVIALTGPGAPFAKPPEAHFSVGQPGVDHPCELHDPAADAIVHRRATAPSDRLSAASVLDALALRLEKATA